MDARRVILLALTAVPLIVLGVVLADYLIVTEEERVAASLHDLASDLAANDAQGVLDHISINAPELREEAKRRLAQVVVHKASVRRNLKVTLSMRQDPPVAVARFNGVVVLSDKLGIITERTVARYFVVNLRQEDGQWRVSRYEDLDPIKRR